MEEQEEVHVCGNQCQRKADQCNKDTEDKESHSLPAHIGGTMTLDTMEAFHRAGGHGDADKRQI